MILFSLIAFFLVLTTSFVLNYLHYMHMFQLNSYSAGEQFRWIKKNAANVFLRHLFPLVGAAYAMAFCFGAGNGGTLTQYKCVRLSDLFICMGFICAGMIFCRKKQPAKKKLVFTPRVIRMCITSAILYAAVIVLAAIYAYKAGGDAMLYAQWSGVILAALCLWQIFSLFMPMIANLLNKPVEKGVNSHYINDAKRIINELPNLTTVGITGSYGKTSTKFYLQKLLSAKYNVLMTPESYNTTMGVVKTVRGSLNATYDIFICEMGAKGVGEIKEICDIVRPKHSMITSIGQQHLETFKSVDNIIRTKFEIADCITDGMVFLNMDNSYIREHKIDKKIVGYGISCGEGKDFYADNITVTVKGTSFTVHAPDGKTKDFSTKLIGEHNVQNIVGAIAVANSLGVSLDELVLPVRRLECVPHRMEIIDKGSTVIIDDAFNSNPSGAKAALDALSLMDGLRVLVTPGMVELGDQEYELNKQLGRQAAVCDFVVLVGQRQAVPLKEGLLEAGYPEEKIYVADNLKDGLDKVDALQTGGKKKIVLLENDLPDNY